MLGLLAAVAWLSREQAQLRLPGAAAAELFKLSQPGEISQPILTTRGICLRKLIGTRAEQARRFDEARPQIERELTRRPQADRGARLRELVRAGLVIRVREDLVGRIVPASAKPAVETPRRMPKSRVFESEAVSIVNRIPS